MKKIKIHRFSNKIWGRAHLPFFQKFEKFLNSFFDVELVEYNQDGNTFSGTINTLRPVSNFGKRPPLSDVDCLIENTHTGEIKVLSFGEYFNNFVGHYAKTPHCSKVLLTHFNWHNLYYWMSREFATSEMYKVRPWIFLPFQEFDYKSYREKRLQNAELNEKMFWQGSGVDEYRKCIRIIENEGHLQPINSMDHNEYLDKLSSTKVAVSYYQSLDRYRTPFDYPGEFCYRDVEYMSIGVPFIRVEFKDTLHDPWIPNYHYISIPRDVAHIVYEKEGEQGIANLYIQRYNEVKDDKVFLDYISKNQIEWFDRNITSPNIENLTFELLELQKWIDDPYDGVYLENVEPEIVNKTIVEKPKVESLDDKEIIEEFFQFLKNKNLIRQNEQNLVKTISNEVVTEETTIEVVEPEEDKNFLKGSIQYRNFTAQQHEGALEVFKNFLHDIRPKRILEIGTAGGGLTLFLRDTLNEIGLSDSKIKSFEVLECPWYDELRKHDIEINLINLFDHSYMNLEKPELIVDFIQSEGTTLVLCDGGYKIGEFNTISDLIKPGDFIMAHDYVDNIENFKQNYFGKIWNWCEINDSYIADACVRNNLIPYNKENFDKVVWVCKQKKVSNDYCQISDFYSLFENKKDVFFLQFGANDGLSYDPIHKIVKEKKWSGILFEPGIEAFEKLKLNYNGFDNLIFENSAVSDYDGKTKLYCGTTTEHFTLNHRKAVDMFDVTPNEREVNVISPRTIVQKYNITKLDLLQIDVEGHDFTILKSFPFDIVKPYVIRFEYVNLYYDNTDEHIVKQFLSTFGYESYTCKESGDIISILKK